MCYRLPKIKDPREDTMSAKMIGVLLFLLGASSVDALPGNIYRMKNNEQVKAGGADFDAKKETTFKILLVESDSLVIEIVDKSPSSTVANGSTYKIAKSDLPSHEYVFIRGFAVGGLVAPFKLRSDDTGTITGNASLGGFGGVQGEAGDIPRVRRIRRDLAQRCKWY